MQLKHTNSNLSLLEYRLAWARTSLRRAGAIIIIERGVWGLTEYGENISEQDCLAIPSLQRKELLKNKNEKKTSLVEDEKFVEEVLEKIEKYLL
jgi:restriction system protein